MFELTEHLQRIVSKFGTVSEGRKLRLNVGKSKTLVVEREWTIPQVEVEMNDDEKEFVSLFN